MRVAPWALILKTNRRRALFSQKISALQHSRPLATFGEEIGI